MPFNYAILKNKSSVIPHGFKSPSKKYKKLTREGKKWLSNSTVLIEQLQF